MELDNLCVEDLSRGFARDDAQDAYQCLYCKAKFTRGVIYPSGKEMVSAELAARRHVSQAHTSPFDALLALDKKKNGLTDTQRRFLALFYQGHSDVDIARITGSSPSTVRYQRFAFRERLRQARVALALGACLENKMAQPGEDDCFVNAAATMVDERYMITAQEAQKAMKACFSSVEPPVLKAFPPKEKRKIVVLNVIARQFSPAQKYSEAEVNAILKPIYDDYATIRRYLISYGFLDRTRDGSAYWRKGEQ